MSWIAQKHCERHPSRDRRQRWRQQSVWGSEPCHPLLASTSKASSAWMVAHLTGRLRHPRERSDNPKSKSSQRSTRFCEAMSVLEFRDDKIAGKDVGASQTRLPPPRIRGGGGLR